jgi:hypothetical protein
MTGLLGAALPTAAQAPEPKAPPAPEKPQDAPRKQEPQPPPDEAPKKKERQEERPRLDAPVSFPVDI